MEMSQMSDYFCGVLQAEVPSIAQQHGFLVTLSSYGLQRGPFLLSVISTMGRKMQIGSIFRSISEAGSSRIYSIIAQWRSIIV